MPEKKLVLTPRVEHVTLLRGRILEERPAQNTPDILSAKRKMR